MPTAPRNGAGALLRLRSIPSLLDQLAKRGAYGEIALASDGSRALNIATQRDGTAVVAVAPWVVFQDACDRGLIENAGPDDMKWILSRLGRVEVRRLRSQGGDPALASTQSSAVAVVCASPRINTTESPLSWLRRRRDKSGAPLITAVQFDASERLSADFLFAEMTPRVTVNWSATGGGTSRSGGGLGIDISDNVAAAKVRVQRALAAVSPMGASLLIDVCGHLRGLEEVERARGWPPRSGKIALQIVLSELARHYRIPGWDGGTERVAQRLRHWGVSDYRPTITPQNKE